MTKKMKLPKYISDIIETIEIEGFEAFVVGGCTRDYLLGKEPKDWDITTNALPEEIMSIFPKTIPTGLKHGTVTVIHYTNHVEITTYRLESTYSDSRHPDAVFFTRNLYEDLSRRDFTMNAIAYSPSTGFIDYFNGIKSIEDRVIYCVGNSFERFSEDALRMMRAIRFSAVLDFDLDKSIIEAIKNSYNLLSKISIERIRDEFVKAVSSDHTEKLILFTQTGLLSIFLPSVACLPTAEQYELFNNLNFIPADRLNARMAAILSKVSPGITKDILKGLRFDNAVVKNVFSIVSNINVPDIDEISIRRIGSKIGIENLRDLIYVWNALNVFPQDQIAVALRSYDNIIMKNQCLSVTDLMINGNDLKSIGISDGIKIGTILKYLLEEVLINPDLNDRNTLITIVKENF